jgi:hypothetical protein
MPSLGLMKIEECNLRLFDLPNILIYICQRPFPTKLKLKPIHALISSLAVTLL